MPDESPTPAAEDLAETIDAILVSGRDSAATDARALLRQAGPTAPETAAIVLRRAERESRARHGRALAFYGWSLLCGALAGPAMVRELGAGLLVSLAFGAVLTALHRAPGARRWCERPLTEAGVLLEALDGPGACGTLAEALWMGHRALAAAAASRLARILPAAALQPGGIPLTGYQRQCLLWALDIRETPGLDVERSTAGAFTWTAYHAAVLDLLARTEDTEALPYVDRLVADTEPASELGCRARACRQRLWQIVTGLDERATLLRPAEPPTSRTLLRPAQPSDVPPERLLRPRDPL